MDTRQQVPFIAPTPKPNFFTNNVPNFFQSKEAVYNLHYYNLMAASELGDLIEFKRLEVLNQDPLSLTKVGGFDIHRVDANGNHCLIAAANKGKLNIVTYLLEKGFQVDKPNKEGATAAWFASGGAHGNEEVLRLLLERGADPNVQPANNQKYAPPLYLAADFNHPEICKILIEFGAVLEAKYKRGSALGIAMKKNNVQGKTK